VSERKRKHQLKTFCFYFLFFSKIASTILFPLGCTQFHNTRIFYGEHNYRRWSAFLVHSLYKTMNTLKCAIMHFLSHIYVIIDGKVIIPRKESILMYRVYVHVHMSDVAQKNFSLWTCACVYAIHVHSYGICQKKMKKNVIIQTLSYLWHGIKW
jgi:hypothetical protein